jgi:phage shock protein PspC (stress-responsive transcriptional regulator)
MATLKKSKKRVIAGVCGGIAKWIDPEINPLGIRLLWFFLGLFHPIFMVIIYVFLAATLRTELTIFQDEKQTAKGE